jgi:predicted phosphoribosyltransferase
MSVRTMLEELISSAPLLADRREAGRELAVALEDERGPETVVVGLARGGVEVAAEVARLLDAPLDAVAVRKVGHPWQPEYGLGAVTPRDGVYLRGSDGLTAAQVERAVDAARRAAVALDARLHAEQRALALRDRTVVIVDDGLATGGTMIAALRWAKAAGAARLVAAVPVGAAASVDLLASEADAVVCPHPLDPFLAVGVWYRSFEQVDDGKVVRILAEARAHRPADASG